MSRIIYRHFKQPDKALQYKAEIFLDSGKPKEAIVAITRAIALDDKDWHSFEIRSQCHQKADNGKLAAQDIHQLNALRNPEH